MFIIDQLRVQDYRLRWVAVGVLAGLGTLLLGLWWVQIFRGERYQESQKDQLYRTVRLPAVTVVSKVTMSMWTCGSSQ